MVAQEPFLCSARSCLSPKDGYDLGLVNSLQHETFVTVECSNTPVPIGYIIVRDAHSL